jgi:glycosyltransferase involved in cell wall biosynthesis
MLQFHLLSFEGPDPYSLVGGLGTRVLGLSQALAALGHDVHHWFVGAPGLPGCEERRVPPIGGATDRQPGGVIHLHRWCQWLSAGCPRGVYEGEHAKRDDYARSLPPHLLATIQAHLLRHQGLGQAVVLAEEWQTAPCVQHLHTLLLRAGIRDRVRILWNANDTYGFHEIDWEGLRSAATITTVSQYMKALMSDVAPEAQVISSGLCVEALRPVSPGLVESFAGRCRDRAVLTKIAPWVPTKRWEFAVAFTRACKEHGLRPLLLARGGREPEGDEILRDAAAAGLRVVDRPLEPGAEGLLDALQALDAVDIINIVTPMDGDSRRLACAGSAAVLANSEHEPFGMVGLETMAAGGVACTGGSGEDYAVPDHNAIVSRSDDPGELIDRLGQLWASPRRDAELRSAGRSTAGRYAWPTVLERELMPHTETSARARARS